MSVLDTQRVVTRSVQPKDVTTKAGPIVDVSYSDEAALEIVTEDFARARGHIDNDAWMQQWKESRILYQSPRGLGFFEGSGVTRSNVSRFTVARQVNSLAPAISAAIFSDPNPFEVRPRGNTTQNTAYAWKALIESLLDEMNFRVTLNRGIETMTNQGTVIMTGGWEKTRRIVKRYVRKQAPGKMQMPLGNSVEIHTKESDDFEAEEKEVTTNRPYFEEVELGTLFPDPKWDRSNELHTAAWVVREHYVTYEDLKDLAEANPDDYTLPSEDELRQIFLGPNPETAEGESNTAIRKNDAGIVTAEPDDQQTSADPLLGPMQLLERWTDGYCMTVLQGKVVIRNGKHKLPGIPFWSANYWNMQGTGWGLGVGRIAGADQRVDQGTINAALDILAFAVNPEYAVSAGVEGVGQDMRRRLGGVRKVNAVDARHAFSLIEQPSVPADVWRVMQASRDESASATGADQATVGGSVARAGSSIGRSSAGASMVGAASSARIQSPVDRVLDGIVFPMLDFLFEMVREFMPTAELREVLGDTWANALIVDMGDMLNARLHFDDIAGTRLRARAAMAQALPFLMQVFENQALIGQLSSIGKKVDAQQLAQMVMDTSGWKNGPQLVVPMSPQEIQQMQQQQPPAAMKMQSELQMLQAKQQGDQALEDQKIHGRLTVNTAREALQRRLEPREGDPPAKEQAQAPGDNGQTSSLDRAVGLAQRLQFEHQLNQSSYFGGAN